MCCTERDNSLKTNNLNGNSVSAEGIRRYCGVFSGRNQEISVKSINRGAISMDLSGKTGTSLSNH